MFNSINSTTLITFQLTLARISCNPNLILTEVSEIAPAAGDQDLNNCNKNQKNDQDHNRVDRKQNSLFSDNTHKYVYIHNYVYGHHDPISPG